MKMRKFVIQYASNLFLHKNDSWKQAKALLTLRKAPNLALLGNIGNPTSEKTKDFVRWCSDNWNHVYCVPGPVELQSESRLNGLFTNIPANVSIMDHSEKHVNQNLLILGCPLWSGHGEAMGEISKWSENQQFFMAYRKPHELKYWHDEDVEFLRNGIQYSSANYGASQKIILLTHNVPHRNFLPSSIETERNVMLYDGDIHHLFSKQVIGCLSGAGGGSVTGNLGPYRAFCGVNAAFLGPSMIPNKMYRPDMTASFSLDDSPWTPKPEPVGGSFQVRFSGLFPIPQLAVRYANPVLQ